MVFTSPGWVPKLPIDPPDSISIPEFIANEKYKRCPPTKSDNPFTCGVTGHTFNVREVLEREDYLARAINARLGFHKEGSPWERVVALFSYNTIDYIPLTHAIHRVDGIVAPLSATLSAAELKHQLQSSQVKAFFTCAPLLRTALEAATAIGLPRDRVFIFPTLGEKLPFTTTEELVAEGAKLPKLALKMWSKGQGARQTAYLCYSSGTSGLPKAVMISHRNVIANVLQLTAYEGVSRNKNGIQTQRVLCPLPLSHIYGLVLMGHLAPYRGEGVIILPKYSLEACLRAIERFNIEQINVVPSILVQIVANPSKCEKFQLGSVRFAFAGGAPLARETIDSVLQIYPKWHIGQAFGMTETSTIATATSELDIFPGSSGSLLPGMTAKILDEHGNEIKTYDRPGELLLQGPSVTLGYLNNEKANADTFVWDNDGRWIRTGDIVTVRKSPNGNEHFFIVDRIKELIKVKGIQVAPAELEAHLLTSRLVSDCAVIQIPDVQCGEVPKAFIVKSEDALGIPDDQAVEEILEHVRQHKVRHKWLDGGVEFIDAIPKNGTGKILRRMLREREQRSRETRMKL